MKKMLSLGALLSISILSGCVTTGEETVSLDEIDFSALTCEKIESTFQDYKANIDSGDSVSSLLGNVSSEAQSTATTAKENAMSIYNSAKEIATPVIELKGCDISI